MKTFKLPSHFLGLLVCFMMIPVGASAQQIQVRGTVVGSDDGLPIMGGSVMVKGTSTGTVTGLDGTYTITADRNATLVFNYVGYVTEEVAIGGRTTIDVVMVVDRELLDDVLVVGYAVGNKRSVSGAVERVKAEDLNTGYIGSAIDALKGKIPGMVISSNGGVNAEPSVRIRGTSSLSGGNDPLVIIDGVFASLSMMNSLPASEIEEITVLKDASETAQYGSRGAAGVIVVTTHRGEEGVTRINYDGQFGVSQPYKRLEMLSPSRWREVNRDMFYGVGRDLGGNTDWMKFITNDVYLQNNHNISLSQSTRKANMRASMGINQRDGALKGANNTTYSARLTSSMKGLNDKLTIELNANASYRKANLGPGTSGASAGVWAAAAAYNPTYPDHRDPDTGMWTADPNVGNMIEHPGEQMEHIRQQFNTRLNGTARATIEIIDGLTASVFGSLTINESKSKSYFPNNIAFYQGTRGQASISNSSQRDWMANAQISYVKTIGKHYINALALVEGQSYYSFSDGATARGFETNYFTYNNLGAGAVVSYGDVSSSTSTNKLLSYMARFNYMFDNKYVITLNARTDGSSKLGANHKWGFFPSASVAWVISNEGFMKDQKLFSTLKLRAGYGVTGNQNAINAYRSLELMTTNGVTSYNNQSVVTYAISSNANPDLKWETKYTLDIGVDFTIFNGRLRGTLDYYNSQTKDLLYTYQVSVPPFTYSSLLANMGQMNNNGVELSLSGQIVKKKDFSFNLSGNMAYLKNELVSLSGKYKDQDLTTSKWIGVSSAGGNGLTSNTGVTYMAEGYPVGIFRLPVFDGFATDENGKKTYTYKDLNNDGKVDLSDSGDREYVGQVVPKITASLNAQFRYKSFDLSLQFNGAFGHKIYNATSMIYSNLNLFPSINILDTAPERGIYDVNHSTYWLRSGNYVNLEYITLGWNAPVSKSKYFSSVRIALSCNNVLTISGYDGLTPMISQSYNGGVDARNITPINRTYNLKLVLGF